MGLAVNLILTCFTKTGPAWPGCGVRISPAAEGFQVCSAVLRQPLIQKHPIRRMLAMAARANLYLRHG